MRIYVCWDTNAEHPVIGKHACGVAYHAVVDAGYDPEVVKAYGWAKLPQALNFTSGRREVRELTGSDEVPVLVLDDGEVVAGSKEIVSWAEANPAPAAS
jgi:Glutathione S-transferase, N-terminal domain